MRSKYMLILPFDVSQSISAAHCTDERKIPEIFLLPFSVKRAHGAAATKAVSGHGLRAGCCTEAALVGVAPRQMREFWRPSAIGRIRISSLLCRSAGRHLRRSA
ncbi:hypothetical protein J2W28_006022 [Variovorax boronicumulans]|uniref:hypothetical protein n=1 Tax=Variovorax boronicumulans TaxID=436515 RepID=UPI002789491D|nr:hypothetical protein [Variovorax boronicumulans]MDP9995686.1 hypothetical protein [Variovorax boronicumulans]MDQ0006849.1 hypothetical protein [Variovorax boronicumulans]